jgi:hypothetical protein
MTWITVEVDVDLSEFEDDAIRKEYESRGLKPDGDNWSETDELTKAYLHHHNGDKDKAYDILWTMCLIKLNKIV